MTAEAFQHQAEALRARLLQTATRYLDDTDEAEDIVQDAMLKLWLMHPQLSDTIDGLGLVIVRNLCIDRLRRLRQTVDISSLADSEDPGDNGEQIEQLMQIVDTLPSAQRTLLRMRHLEGMEMREIALVTGSSEVAVRKALSRARLAVRRKMLAWLAAACLLVGLSVLTIHLLRLERDDDCVTLVYGKRYTDEATALRELHRTMGDIAEDNPEQEIKQQLIDLFSDHGVGSSDQYK